MSNDKNILTKTNDGYVVELFAKTKMDIENEIKEIAEGVSLLETEKNQTEEKQFLKYKEIVEKMEERPVIIKASDKGKDVTILKTQLRAVLRAGKYGDLSIIFSGISSPVELNEVKEILDECKNELEKEGIPYKKHIKVGAVIEIPSATLMSYEIARECDFLFIETNSLTNYTFGGQQKNYQIQKVQSAIIKLIRQAVEGAHDAGIFCGICGEIVEDELYMPLLIGLGIDEFTMNSEHIIKVRKLISTLDKSDCKELANEVLHLRKLEDIENKLKRFAQN